MIEVFKTENTKFYVSIYDRNKKKVKRKRKENNKKQEESNKKIGSVRNGLNLYTEYSIL